MTERFPSILQLIIIPPCRNIHLKTLLQQNALWFINMNSPLPRNFAVYNLCTVKFAQRFVANDPAQTLSAPFRRLLKCHMTSARYKDHHLSLTGN